MASTEASTDFVHRPTFEEYKEQFKQHFYLERKNGIILVRMHTNGGPVKWSYQIHNALGQLWRVVGNDPENKKATYDQMFKLEKGGKQFKAMGDWMRGLGHQGPIEMESLERLGEALCNRIFKTRIAYGRQRDDGTHFLFFNNIRVKGGAVQETIGTVDEEEAPF